MFRSFQFPKWSTQSQHRSIKQRQKTSRDDSSRHRKLRCEVLEDRRLLNGVTIITHGYESSDAPENLAWVDIMRKRIAEHIASVYGGQAQDVAQFNMIVTNQANPEVTDWRFGGSFVRTAGTETSFSLSDSLGGEVVIELDWSDIAGLFDNVPTEKVASLVSSYLSSSLGNLGQQLLSAPIHLIGHSRGASLMAALAEDLGEVGLWVEQLTLLDPCPIVGDYGIGLSTAFAATVTSNVVFADNYYESSYIFCGNEVAGASNLGPLIFSAGGYGIVGGAHSDVHLWYQGTIDTKSDTVYDGSASFDADADGWYNGGFGPRNNVGYYYSRLGGGNRLADCADGLLWGGDDIERQAVSLSVDESNAWDNVAITGVDSQTYNGVSLNVLLKYKAHGNLNTITVGYDTDANPYNASGNTISTTIDNVSASGTSYYSSTDCNLTTAGLTSGSTYYVYAKISDGIHTRYYYFSDKITIGNHKPTLSDLQASPSSGSTSQTYTFSVHYNDAEGNAPTIAQIYVDGAFHTMTLASGTVSDGVYAYSTTLAAGSYAYFFEFSDGRYQTRSAVLAGPVVTSTATGQALSINDASVLEGSGTTSLIFTVTLSQASSSDVYFGYQTINGTASTSDNDYVSACSLGKIAHGQTTATITIQINGDSKAESDEYFYVDLITANGATIADGRGKGTILNDDGTQPTVNINDVTHLEGDSGTTRYDFTVSLTHAATTDVKVYYHTSDGTAGWQEPENDYQHINDNLIYINRGDTTATITVYVRGDTTIEPDEYFTVDISKVVGADCNRITGYGIIENDDGLPTLSIADSSVAEAAGPAVFTVTLSEPSAKDVSVDYATSDDSAQTGNDDYVCTSGTLVIPAGSRIGQISVTILNDSKAEADEQLCIDLSNASRATISKSHGIGTIQNDDVPTLSIDDVTLLEGNSGSRYFTFTVGMSGVNTYGAGVNYTTADGTAVAANGDYEAVSGTLSWAPGNTSPKTLSVVIFGDATVEPDEAFYVNLSGANGATISDGQGIGTIQDDDMNPLLVTITTDVVNGNDGLISLREAVAYANSHPGSDTIEFDSSLSGKTIVLAGEQLTLTDTSGTTTISGLGVDILTVSGNNTSRVFYINNNVNVSFLDLTIAGGNDGDSNDPDGGAGICNRGTLTIEDCVVTGNRVLYGYGGGIYSDGSITIRNTTISNNSGSWAGGMCVSGTATIVGCTISGNISADGPGGISSNALTLMINSTIAGNSGNCGGGILNTAAMTIVGCTIAANSTTSYGGGIRNQGAYTTVLRNTIVAANAGNNVTSPDIDGTVTADYCLIGDITGTSFKRRFRQQYHRR